MLGLSLLQPRKMVAGLHPKAILRSLSRLHPNVWKFVLACLALACLALWCWHFWQHLTLTASRAVLIGWPKVLHTPAKLEPFLLACTLNWSCFKAVHFPALKSTSLILDALMGIVLIGVPFAWILLSPRRRMLYNSRWATLGKLAKVTYGTDHPALEQGIQLAVNWAYYPELKKNRHGYLTLPAWGDKPGPNGGQVIAVTASGNKDSSKPKRELTHTLITGPTRSGKGLAITQNLLVWTGNAIVNDPKGENHRLTAAYRQEELEQKVFVIDPRGNGHRFDPFEALRLDPEGLRAAANIILETHTSNNPIFAQRATNALYAALRAAKLKSKATLPFLRELTKTGLPGFVQTLEALKDDEIHTALTDFLNESPTDLDVKAKIATDKFLSSAWSTLTTKLQPLFSPGVLATASGSDLKVETFLKEATTLYLRFSETDVLYTRTFLKLVWLSLTNALIDAADARGSVLPIRTLLVLDEAKAVPMPNLQEYVSTMAGRGLTAMILIQDLSQLEAAYGEENAQAIMANCKTQVFFKTPEQNTRKQVSERAGRLMVADKHLQKSKDGYVTTWRSLERELITPDEVERLHEENVIVFMDNQLPVLARRLNYLEHPAWEVAQGLPVPEVEPIQAIKLEEHQSEEASKGPSAEVQENQKAAGGQPKESQGQALPDHSATEVDAQEKKPEIRKAEVDDPEIDDEIRF